LFITGKTLCGAGFAVAPVLLGGGFAGKIAALADWFSFSCFSD